MPVSGSGDPTVWLATADVQALEIKYTDLMISVPRDIRNSQMI